LTRKLRFCSTFQSLGEDIVKSLYHWPADLSRHPFAFQHRPIIKLFDMPISARIVIASIHNRATRFALAECFFVDVGDIFHWHAEDEKIAFTACFMGLFRASSSLLLKRFKLCGTTGVTHTNLVTKFGQLSNKRTSFFACSNHSDIILLWT